eukprot:TRINITY_DN56847_c0_g1_i4.p1 TRINITY_DN56847_c0_g1~~TRINITY_DN56847_c0_g1_i4.p1  ORF type:complete len:169 (+),score=40.95 TRINITY_DN56847_c0_g1_i4:47-553(+)
MICVIFSFLLFSSFHFLSVFFFFKQKTAYEMLRSLVGSEMCIRDRAVTKYIQVIPVDRFPSLVGVSLTPELLCGVVQATLNLEAAQAYKWMESIASVRRVDELLILMTDAEEEMLREGVSHARTSGQDMAKIEDCLLYTSDAADEEDSVDLGGRRIIKKKKRREKEAE